MKLPAALTLLVWGIISAGASTFDVDSLKTVLSQRPLASIEGIWQWTDGATMAISRVSPGVCRIVMLDSPDLRVVPGAIAGQATATTSADTWDITLATRVDNSGALTKHGRFTARVDDNGTLKLEPYKVGYKWNWWRALPHLFRFRVEKVNTRPSGLDGGTRIFPPNLTNPHEPIVL